MNRYINQRFHLILYPASKAAYFCRAVKNRHLVRCFATDKVRRICRHVQGQKTRSPCARGISRSFPINAYESVARRSYGFWANPTRHAQRSAVPSIARDAIAAQKSATSNGGVEGRAEEWELLKVVREKGCFFCLGLSS